METIIFFALGVLVTALLLAVTTLVGALTYKFIRDEFFKGNASDR